MEARAKIVTISSWTRASAEANGGGMGDLVGDVVEGRLLWVPKQQFERILQAPLAPEARAALFADACRLNVLYMVARAGSGHLGSSFSSIDIVSWLYLHELSGLGASSADADAPRDLYFSSKGHDAPGLYAVRTALGELPFELIHQLRVLGGLPGHPDIHTPGTPANTGSLGMGISKAKGMVWAQRKRGSGGRVYVMTGDGELQEGQIWESLVSAVNQKMHELTVIVDHNKLQSDTFVDKTSALGDLAAKFSAFGWHVQRVNGHDFAALRDALASARAVLDRPQVLLADTIKGRGVSFMEHTSLDSDVSLYRFHSGAPDPDSYQLAASQLVERLAASADALGLERLTYEADTVSRAPSAGGTPQRLIAGYSRALLKQAKEHPELVVLDADLVVDTGQLPTREAFPERFIECGIAEMDMVSQAGSLARRGFLPICHSFACFMAPRANEHIYNNATEEARVIYVASLAGLLPAGPGHSHQSVRDVSAVSGVPGLVVLEPCTEADVARALEFAVQGTQESVWLRLVSVPYEVPFEVPDAPLEVGKGSQVRPGKDGLFFAAGPVMLTEAWHAATLLEEQGLSFGVLAMPWYNRVDLAWLGRTVAGQRHLFTVDNHYLVGGLGERIAVAVNDLGLDAPPRVHRFGVESVPACGRNQEVLEFHRLDRKSLAERVRKLVEI
jgi:transketolase